MSKGKRSPKPSREELLDAVASAGGDRKFLAEQYGVTEATIGEWMRNYDIDNQAVVSIQLGALKDLRKAAAAQPINVQQSIVSFIYVVEAAIADLWKNREEALSTLISLGEKLNHTAFDTDDIVVYRTAVKALGTNYEEKLGTLIRAVSSLYNAGLMFKRLTKRNDADKYIEDIFEFIREKHPELFDELKDYLEGKGYTDSELNPDEG